MRATARKRRVKCLSAVGASCCTACLVLLAACRRETPARQNDTPRSSVTPPITTPTDSTAPTTWDVQVGAILAVPASSPSSAFVIVPRYTSDSSLDSASFDLPALNGSNLGLLANGRLVARAKLTGLSVARDSDCTSWPTARVELQGAGVLPTWSAGFADGSVEPIPFDSLQVLSPADSTRLNVELAKLASAVPNDTAAAFRGRPFVVRTVRRFQISARSVVIAEVIRSVNQEATPLQEHLLLVAERDTASTAGYQRSYYERTIGLEDAVEATDLLAVVHPMRSETVYLLVSRDFGDGVSYALLERRPAGTWRLRWSSAYAGC